MLHQPRLMLARAARLLGLVVVIASSSGASPSVAAELEAAPAPTPATVIPVNASDYQRKVVAPHRGRVLVVNFWATWCAPCLVELPELQRAHARFPKGSVDVVLVSADIGKNAPADIQKALAKVQVRYPSFLQQGGDPEDLINVVDASWQGDLPYTIVYDAKGARVLKLMGVQDEAAFVSAIERALSPSAEPAPAARTDPAKRTPKLSGP